MAAAGRQDAARDTRANEKAILASLREEGKKLLAIDTKKFEDFRKTLKEGVGEAEAYSIKRALQKNKELDCMDSSTQQLRADAEQKFKDYHFLELSDYPQQFVRAVKTMAHMVKMHAVPAYWTGSQHHLHRKQVTTWTNRELLRCSIIEWFKSSRYGDRIRFVVDRVLCLKYFTVFKNIVVEERKSAQELLLNKQRERAQQLLATNSQYLLCVETV